MNIKTHTFVELGPFQLSEKTLHWYNEKKDNYSGWILNGANFFAQIATIVGTPIAMAADLISMTVFAVLAGFAKTNEEKNKLNSRAWDAFSFATIAGVLVIFAAIFRLFFPLPTS